MQQPQTIKAQKLLMDVNPKYVPSDSSPYLLNNEVSVNPNGGTNNGASLGKSTPFAANYPACEINQPAGENYASGTFHSIRTNETYSWIYNSNGVHYIQRINGNGDCQIVYHGDCLKISASPRHTISQWRGHMRIEKVCPYRDGKYLQWVDGDGANGYIDTEASIATNFFTTPFFDICNDPCAYINLCVPQPCGCLSAEFVPLEIGQQEQSNYLLEKGFKFMFKHVYYDGRQSEWSDRSSLYYLDAKRCFYGGLGAPRCIKFRLPVGNPMVEKIIVGYSEDGGNTWYEYETIEKYKKYNSSQDKWYNRELSEQITSPDANFSQTDCAFDYLFCNDKQKKSIAPEQISRVRNPYPRKPQFLLPIGEAVAYGNYEDGNCPIDEIETEKVNIDINCTELGCNLEYATITVRAVIHSVAGNNGYLYKLGAEKDETVFWGGAWRFQNGNVDPVTTFGQQFKGDIQNFIVYIEGTDYWGEMKQWKSDAYFQNTKEWGILENIGQQSEANAWAYFVAGNNSTGSSNGGFFYQEYKFKVPKGTRGFVRMVSHQATDGKGSSQNTSSTIVGILDITQYAGSINARNISDLSRTEIYFDTCNGDTDLNKQAFLIGDLALHNGTAITGYIKDSLGLPVEGAVIAKTAVFSQQQFSTNPLTSRRTDFNGFYWTVTYPENQADPNPPDVRYYILVELSCAAFSSIKFFDIIQDVGFSVEHNEQLLDSTYTNGSYATVKMSVNDCNGDRVKGLLVAISGSKARVTDNNGVATFKIRNYDTRNRKVTLVLMDGGGCFTQDCNGNCSPCFEIKEVITDSCYFTSPPSYNLGTVIVNVDSVLDKVSLKRGGLYDFGFIVEGDCGRLSAVNKIQSISIPKMQEKEKIDFCNFSFDATGIELPDWGKCFKIVRSENKNPYVLQWVVDKVQRDPNGRISLTIQSLNDYNESFFFKTNTVYQWLEGDRIEFVRNGDGKTFTLAQYGLLNYLTISPYRDLSIGNTETTDVNYFNQLIIMDDGRLGDLKEGATIELQRPKQSTSEVIYKEICVSVPIIQVPNGDGTTHGELLNPTGTFNTFDTFLVTRRANSYLGVFEHNAPSDFWGSKFDDTGKVHFLNQYETERRYGRNLTIASPTQVNYFGNLIKRFDANEQGDIVAMNTTDDNIIMAICENDNFLAQVANDLLRVGSNGIVIAQPADSIVSDPQSKPIGTYGCQYDHVGSIIFYDGGACWADVNKYAFVKHDFNIATDISENRVKVYTQKRFQDIEFENRNTINDLDKLRFVVGQNSQTKSIYWTIKKFRDSGINNERKPLLKSNDTIIYNPIINEFLGFAGFTPEAYSQVNLFDGSGASFVTFMNGLPYYHPVLADKWNEFYGQSVDWMVCICANQFPEKEKVFLAMEIQSETMFYVPYVETNNSNYLSEIPPIKVKRNGDKWNAAFLGNKNSREGLFGSNPPRGYYAKILLIRDNSLNLAYNTIDDSKRTVFSELDLVMVKSVALEQSGFTGNL